MPDAIQIDPFQIAWFSRWKATYRYKRVGSFRETYGWPMYPSTRPGRPFPYYSSWMMREFSYSGDMDALIASESANFQYWYMTRPISLPVAPWPASNYFLSHYSGTTGVLYCITTLQATVTWTGAASAALDHIPDAHKQTSLYVEDAMPSGFTHPFLETLLITTAFQLVSVEPDT